MWTKFLANLVFAGAYFLVSSGQAHAGVHAVLKGAPPSAPAPGVTRALSYIARGTWTGIQLPADAVNLALRSGGAHASASSTAEGFDPNGVLDGNWTAEGWGKGHGWQSGKNHEFPCWLEVRLPHAQDIDTVLIETFPPVMRGLNWWGVRNLDLHFERDGKWLPAGSVRGNVEGFGLFRLVALKTSAIRITINRVNNGNEEDPFYDDETYARILQMGIFKLRIPEPVSTEEVSVQVESGRLGNIAIFRDRVPAPGIHSSSPEYLASLFRQAGYGVTFLNAKALTVPEIFNRKNFDVFVQPYGAPFPVGTLLYDFLREGGHLITMGGHPFTRALMFSPEGGLVDAGYDPGITTSRIRPADYFLAFRQQLGMFYLGNDYLEDVAYAETTPDQVVIQAHFKVNTQLRGRSATALVGERVPLDEGRRYAESGVWPTWVEATREGLAPMPGLLNALPDPVVFGYLSGYTFNWPRSRWTSLVSAYDRLGRLKGSVVSLLANYAGPYRGSGWVFCGVENEDLFSAAHPEFTRVLLESLQFLRSSALLHNVDPELECYKQGETAKVAASVDNFRTSSWKTSLKFQFFPEGASSPVFSKTVDLSIAPGQGQRLSVEWNPPRFDSDLYRVRVTLMEEGREIDRTETGFLVWNPKTIAQGIPVDFRQNYFQMGDRSQFLVGTRTNGLHLHGQTDEGVLDWDRKFAAMRDSGMQVVAPVFLSMFIPGLAWGKPGRPAVPEPIMRMIDAQVQLAQRHRLIYAPCLFFLAKYLAMEQPELTRRICEEFGRRYFSVPGIIFYIFDDGFGLYGVEAFRNWARICVEGLNSAGRKYLVLAEFASLEDTAVQRYGTTDLAFPSSSVYGNGYPVRYRLIDMRAAGKSFHNSEFGVLASGSRPEDFDHTRWPGIRVPGSPIGDNSVYLIEPHLMFALGGAGILNWDWSDPSHVIFPWGIRHPNDHTSKQVLLTYRNESYFFRHFRPAFEFPKALVVIPREHLMRDVKSFVPYLKLVINELVEHSVQFAVLDDVDLDRIPPGPHVLLFPDPRYAAPDILYKLQSRVEAGDTLFISGDFTKPLRETELRDSSLFEKTLGLRWVADRPAGAGSEEVLVRPTEGGLAISPYLGRPVSRFQAVQATVLATDAEGTPVVTSNRLGAGTVFFTSDTSEEGTHRIINAFLEFRAVPSTAIFPSVPHRPVFELPRADGGRIYTVLAVRPEGKEKTSESGPWIHVPEHYAVTVGEKRIDLTLGSYGVALFSVRGDNSIDALEGQGQIKEGETVLLESEPHVMLMALDGQAVNQSQAIALFPLGTGKVSILTAREVNRVEVGEISSGQFRLLENVKSSHEGGKLTFQIDSTQSRGVLLITSDEKSDGAHQLMNASIQ